MQRFDLIIFDCDGVLIDSELLSAKVLMGMITEIGLPITPAIFRSDFLGRSFAAAAARFELRNGRALPENFQMDYRARLLQQMRGNLRIMPGTRRVLDALTIPFCLATSSSPERLAVSLAETGLGSYFTERCFTSTLVAMGKPAPDLYLHTAHAMGHLPARCLAIEDSEMGVRAGLAAGMETWHFTGGGHMAEVELPYDVQPQRTIASMEELHAVLAELGLCSTGRLRHEGAK